MRKYTPFRNPTGAISSEKVKPATNIQFGSSVTIVNFQDI